MNIYLIYYNILSKYINMNRIMKEISIVQKSSELFIDVDEKDMTQFNVMFFGPPDSVYHHGIFIFKMKISPNYPFTVPSVTFLTGGLINARIHPNLYKEGKVCLSILNTWGKNEWSPLLTIEKVFITIRALLDNNPIVHEPGFDKNHPSSNAYNINATYYSLKSIIDVYGFYHNDHPFKNIIKTYLSENKQSIIDHIDRLLKKLHLRQNLQTFHHTGQIDSKKLEDVKELLNSL